MAMTGLKSPEYLSRYSIWRRKDGDDDFLQNRRQPGLSYLQEEVSWLCYQQ